MIYDDFLLELNKTEFADSQELLFDRESFENYIFQIDNYLYSYFYDGKSLDNFAMLKSLASGKTIKEISNEYSLSQERIRQIVTKTISKINIAGIVERNKHLYSAFYLLCSIGSSELYSFLVYLISKQHVLVLILKKILLQKGFKQLLLFDKEKHITRELKPREKFAPDEEIKKVLKDYYFYSGMNAIQINAVATFLEDDYKSINRHNFSGKVTWNKIVDLLVQMKNEN